MHSLGPSLQQPASSLALSVLCSLQTASIFTSNLSEDSSGPRFVAYSLQGSSDAPEPRT
jgi:hypothetical protein